MLRWLLLAVAVASAVGDDGCPPIMSHCDEACRDDVLAWYDELPPEAAVTLDAVMRCIEETAPPAVDCEGEYEEQWSPCSQPCGGGYRAKEFVVETPASGGGEACPEAELLACNEIPCPLPVFVPVVAAVGGLVTGAAVALSVARRRTGYERV